MCVDQKLLRFFYYLFLNFWWNGLSVVSVKISSFVFRKLKQVIRITQCTFFGEITQNQFMLNHTMTKVSARSVTKVKGPEFTPKMFSGQAL